jgi:hypothetical protein
LNFEIDILEMPSYGERASDYHSTYRYNSSRGGEQVDLGHPSNASTLSKAQKWAGIWSEATWKYIGTGSGFSAESEPELKESIPLGGWKANYLDTYRTTDSAAFFKFRFVNVGSYYEIDILEMPSYAGRSSDQHTTHRLNSTRGGQRICFGDPNVASTLNKAQKWAGIWSEATWKYIRTGVEMPTG